MKYITQIICFDPIKLENKAKEISKEKGIENFNNYDFTQIWEDSQGYTVSEHYIEDFKTKERIHLTLKNSWQRDNERLRNINLVINND
jgi:hypothetical protein